MTLNGGHLLPDATPHRRRTRAAIRALPVPVLLLVSGGAALAQSTPPPSLPQPPTREEILRTPPPTDTGPVPLSVSTDDSVERSPCPLASPEFSNVRLTLREVRFTNAANIDPVLLSSAWQSMVGQDLPIAAVCEIRDRAATNLRQAGYLAAVRVPVQTIDNGVVTLDIMAARLSGLQVRGDAGANERLLARYLSKIEGQELFNIYDAERYLILANSIPGMNTRLTLRPAGMPGQVIGEIAVSRMAGMVDANIQNFGSHAVGRFGGIARVRLFGLTGMGDETALSFYSTADFEEQKVAQASHAFRIGGEGLTFSTDFTYAWTRPGIGGGLSIDSQSLIWTTAARYPLTLRQARSLWVSGGFDWIDQDVKALDTLLSRDKLRVLWAGADFTAIDPAAFTGRDGFSPAEPRWSAALRLQARQGIGAFGASGRCPNNSCILQGRPISRPEADTTATVLRAEGEFVWRPVKTVALAVMPRAQYAHNPLLSYEEFSAGNFTVGRGYDPGTLTGDSGVAATGEIRVGSLIPRSRRDVAWQPFAFFDAARVWNKDSEFAGIGRQRLYSAGGGVRVVWGDRLRIDLAVAEPLSRAGLGGTRPKTRFLISLSTQFGFGR
jgi:hemolysin activation/secretion protein